MKKFIPTTEQLERILKMYNEDLMGSHSIAKEIGVSKPTILRILKENDVEMGPSGRRFIGGRKVAMKKYHSKPETKERKRKNYDKWYENNKEHRKQYLKEYRENNIEKIRKTKRDYERNRKARDPLYKLISNFRTAIYQVLKESNVDKNEHYFDVLPYSQEELIQHLENQFTDDLTWDNYGEWHLDHIIPISSFNIQEMGDEEFIKCWSLKNLQPLWGEENIRKSNSI
ncbi:hypothetical protein OAB94_02760 [Flavobacteriaceae bacterium]|nr:hypothetical protein [bacterium]MDB0072684.1 hypothetical protein [bacterium]MDB4234946.1 hypothetical protein [bacterium]MDB4351849.1 hypothetical protein [Porticoccaceae bacterium]MDB9801279.1 hypothetical protein [Flavobacteriaceae bacterium]